MRDYKKLFEAGNVAQLEKLHENEHKPEWNDMTFDELRRLIMEEYEETEQEMIKREVDYKLLRHECADLANACHFMIQKCDSILNSQSVYKKIHGEVDA